MRDWRAYTGKELFELTLNLDATIERQGQMIVKQAEELQAIANKVHYPDCWDTMAYPTLLDAIHECYDGCSQCGGGFVDGMQS